MACFMDPRFKAGYVSGDKLHEIKSRVISEIEATFSKEESHDAQQDRMDPPEDKQKTSKRSLGSFFKCALAPRSTTISSHLVDGELNSYLVSPTIDSEDLCFGGMFIRLISRI
uniref:Uncharacterized protein n=1 Tax=Knipowitschia caucasica TaxID=637954 RepID=A0AAV2M4M2_KNICA